MKIRNMRPIVILHIVFDSVLFDKVYPRFESMNGYENRYLFRGLHFDKSSFKNVKNCDKIICADSLEEWGAVVNDPRNDIIYFHALWKDSLKAVDFIRKEAIVMWWCFGYEIYENEYGWAPLLPVKVYKPRTFLFFLRNSNRMRSLLSRTMTLACPWLYDFLQNIRYSIQGRRLLHKELLGRIDLAFTPLLIELDELKKRHPYIKAKPYALRTKSLRLPFDYQGKLGHILFDHSAMLNNNHLDLLAAMKKLHLSGRDVYMPLSYGDQIVVDHMLKHASLKGVNIHFLTEVLSSKDYRELLSHCSHALFGTIRQSGLGNVNILLRMGVKIFFFEDSIMYKHFKREGYYVFSIENDLNDVSISTPLTYDMAIHNYNLFYQKEGELCETGTYQQQFDSLLSSFGFDESRIVSHPIIGGSV